MEHSSTSNQVITLIAILAAFGAAMVMKVFKPEGHGLHFAVFGIVLVAIILFAVFGLNL